VYRLPQVLLLHIKRFKYSGSSREKLTNNVGFPVKVQCSVQLLMLQATAAALRSAATNPKETVLQQVLWCQVE